MRSDIVTTPRARQQNSEQFVKAIAMKREGLFIIILIDSIFTTNQIKNKSIIQRKWKYAFSGKNNTALSQLWDNLEYKVTPILRHHGGWGRVS
jgi:hypothetical protein